MNGGGLFETGAGGSAPKHVEQFTTEGHLRWDSLGEFLALAVSLDHLGDVSNNPNAKVLGATLDDATDKLLENKKGPSRKVKELDNRGSHFYIAKYWAEALANQSESADLSSKFKSVSDALNTNEGTILSELTEAQGSAVNIGGYYEPNEALTTNAMRASATLNAIIDAI
jgi:isocitrate dehydrogenase